jgi:uncharacterized protein
MTVEYLPVGIACNIKCAYCYQDPMRDAGNINVPRDWDKAKETISRLDQTFSVFGGEALLTPISHLKEVFEFGYNKYGQNGVQTNGSLITDEHIELFKQYNVQVGISIDGPGSLNDVRCSLELTEKTEIAIGKLLDLKMNPSLIVTIHRGNNDLHTLLYWVDGLIARGLKYVNFHELEVECGKEHVALPEEENIRTFLELYEWSKKHKLNFSPFSDIKSLLTQEDAHANCVWNACDPLTTPAVQGVNPDGIQSNCGRTNKDGINWVKSTTSGNERYLALYYTPQEFGGCKDCKYFAFCKGHCPGTAINGDWRNRTVNCRLWYSLFEKIEEDNLSDCLPASKVKELEQRVLGMNPDEHIDKPHGDSHEDHTDRGIPATILTERPEGV